jgi:hypothetical protein
MNPFRQLHPTLRKCKCGFVGKKSEFHAHMIKLERELVHKTGKMGYKAFFQRHGEVPIYTDTPIEYPDYATTMDKEAKRQAIVDSI